MGEAFSTLRRKIMRFGHMAAAGIMALAGLSFAPVASAQQQTHLSQCARNGLMGAGAGALVGALVGGHHRGRNAVLGAAVGGVGTWGVCHLLSNNEQQRVDGAYQRSLSSDHSVSQSWNSNDGRRDLYVSRPASSDQGPQCRRVSATVSDATNGNQRLPPETFCRDGSGQWVPA
jgi:hypothetical protein